jgi:filamentous hemagglutinin family protein
MRRISLGFGLAVYLSSGTAQAQTITPDGTLNTNVTPIGLNTIITNGTAVGSNLFHSFREFSVPTGGAAIFDLGTTPNIATIFSRVTGSNPSSIDGLIQTSRPANLFLLNPNGILFGPNAFLNVGGSFVGTTANSIQFADGIAFSATDLTPNPLLTMSVPIGLQFGTGTNGAIQVQGKGNDGIVPTNNLGMIASPGQTIALIGGDVTFTSGVVTAPVGRIEIGAVGSGTVSLTPTLLGLQFGYDQVQTFRDVSLTARSALWNPYPVGNPFGGIQVVSRDLRLDQSQIAAATVGAGRGGNIVIRIQRSLDLSGVNAKAQAPSAWIVNQVAPGATGNSGTIDVQAGQIMLRDGAAIHTFSAGSGKAGNIRVVADTISAQGTVIAPGPVNLTGVSASRIASDNFASGASGDIVIAARQLSLEDGARIITFVAPTASGLGGNVTVTVADTIFGRGISPLDFGVDGIGAITIGSGNGGNVQVTAGNLTLLEGASLATVTSTILGLPGSGTGNAGNLQVSIREALTVSGVSPFNAPSSSFLGSSTQGSGHAGDVTITARDLSVSNLASITSNSLSIAGQVKTAGNGGNLTLTADRIEVTSGSLGTFTFTSGDAKDTLIQANQIIVRDGGFITTNTAASGNAGQLTVKANDILVSGIPGFETSISSSALILDPSTRKTFGLPDMPTGNTGSLNLQTERLTLQNGGQISVQHAGTGNAGQLDIQAQTIFLNDGNITASTASGQGGNLSLRVQDTLIMRQGSTISAESGGIGDGGNLNINAKFVIGLGNSDIIANAFNGNGGNIQIATQGIFGLKFRDQLTPDNDITASSQFGVSGNVQITNPGVDLNAGLLELPTDLIDPTRKIASGCAANQGSSFIVTGRGGVPVNPQSFSSDRTWGDLRDLASVKTGRLVVAPDHLTAAPPAAALIEATGWHRNVNGQLELFAATAAGLPPLRSATCALAPKPQALP